MQRKKKSNKQESSHFWWLRTMLTQRKKTWGFTLIELLVSMLIGSIVVSGILMFVVQLSETDRKELALTQTERDMSFALDYMSSELKEAIYVYENECLGTTPRGTANTDGYCPGLRPFLNLPSGVEPVLAFWKIEPLPYTPDDPLPDNCNSFSATATPPTTSQQDCLNVLLNRSSYTFVVYGIRRTPSGQRWLGPSQITRYQLRQYQTVRTLSQTTGYVDPTNQGVTFSSWPNVYSTGARAPGLSNPNLSEDVLVDLVDWQTDVAFKDWDTSLPGIQGCPEPISPRPTDSRQLTYSFSYPQLPNVPNDGTSPITTSFSACIRRPQSGQTQDVFVNIRGNAVRRAGLPDNRNPAYLPAVSAQVQSRSVFIRNPTK